MTDVYEDFIASQRSGRRNAVHEISVTPGVQGPANLSQSLEQLNINKSGGDVEDSKKSQDSPLKGKGAEAEGS